MKRKKWSEQEEQTLLSKYSELVSSGALSKLKTREKKFKPIADHVTAAHHGSDPSSFPFRWSWRDVSVKVQNMRHQYLGVKQKIRLPGPHRFDWPDGVNHWHNFLRYKLVFGDLDLPQNDAVEDEADEEEEREGSGLGFCGAVARREERRREREEERERGEEERAERRERAGEERERGRERAEREREAREEREEGRVWERVMGREGERRRRRREREEREERRRRMRAEELREEEEMEWLARAAEMEMEEERRAMRAHAEACRTQMQALGAVARLLGQGFVPPGDGLGPLPPQVAMEKPDATSPAEFM